MRVGNSWPISRKDLVPYPGTDQSCGYMSRGEGNSAGSAGFHGAGGILFSSTSQGHASDGMRLH